MKSVLLAPGYGGDANQPILVKLRAVLEPLGFKTATADLSGKLSKDYEREIAVLKATRDAELRPGFQAFVGRSFGGRICAFLASREPPDALVLLGHPIRPEGKRRLLDEEALRVLSCPTLIIQGKADPLGPLRVLRPFVRKNSNLALEVISVTGHSFGRHEADIAVRVSHWLAERLAHSENR